MTDVPVGLKIKRARERRRWTQRRLAEEIGDVSFKTVGNWERGLSYPRNAIGRIEEVLGISLTEGMPDPVVSDIRAMTWLTAEEQDAWVALYYQRKSPQNGAHRAG
jgi:transcriptional regulator with XRE-family HTH domain